MPNQFKVAFLEQLQVKYGKPKQMPGSLSLFEVGDGLARIYIRYSRVHPKNRTFFGLRQDDLKQLEGLNAVICFLWDTQSEPVFIPYADFEDIFNSLTPASDGQYKVQIYPEEETELYIANAGRFNIEGFYGWRNLDNLIDKTKIDAIPDFGHSQIQTLIGAIGILKGYDVWIPLIDRNKLDWSLSKEYTCCHDVPSRYEKIDAVLKEVDVIWIQRGSSILRAIFEVEHSTPIYSGLLRFNDLHLVEPNLKLKYSIVANYMRRSLFLRQINRPTFKMSGLGDVCSFMEYRDVYSWFNRMKGREE
ncbi:hypothetical protein ACFLQW_02465 [Candidatus Zixiibacteriota bacterium]